jgi:hypothetical protein
MSLCFLCCRNLFENARLEQKYKIMRDGVLYKEYNGMSRADIIDADMLPEDSILLIVMKIMIKKMIGLAI